MTGGGYGDIGGAEGDRTPDLMTASHALSQLSYGPRKVLVQTSLAFPFSQASVSVRYFRGMRS